MAGDPYAPSRNDHDLEPAANLVISVHSGRNTCSRTARTQPQLGDLTGISDGRLSDVSVDAFHDLNLRHRATLHDCPAHEVLLSAPDTSDHTPGLESRKARIRGLARRVVQVWATRVLPAIGCGSARLWRRSRVRAWSGRC
jgi:hypothetical protein